MGYVLLPMSVTYIVNGPMMHPLAMRMNKCLINRFHNKLSIKREFAINTSENQSMFLVIWTKKMQ